MRMQFKYFVLLLVISLAPLVLATWVSHRSGQDLGREISQTLEDRLGTLMAERLQGDARAASKAVRRDRTVLTLSLQGLAGEVERRLVRSPVPGTRTYFSSEYEDPYRAPRDLAMHDRYVRLEEDGTPRLLPVSFGHQVFTLAPGTDRGRAVADVARLAKLLPHFQALYRQAEPSVYRVMVCLESGVTAAYPGFGGYPPKFDPRTADWYRKARASGGEPVMSGLLVSRATGQLLFAHVVPVAGRGGAFAGVAVAEVELDNLLKESQLAESWAGQARSYLVFPDTNPDTGEPGLKVLAKSGYERRGRALLESDYEWLSSDEDKRFAELVGRIMAGESGVLSLDFEGEPYSCAFAPLEGGVSFLLAAPESAVAELPAELTGMVADSVRKQRLVALGGVAAVILALAAFWGARRESRAVMTLIEAWRKLAAGDFTVRADVRTGDERELLAKAFNETVPKLAEGIQMKQSLAMAREVQQGLMPSELPSVPNLELAGTSRFCDETGGDYLDGYRLRDGRLIVTVGDVSGHGVSSALLMATVRAMFRALGGRGSLSERVARVNQMLCRDVQRSARFMTLVCLEYHPDSGRLTYVRAGHDPALLYDPDTGAFTELEGEGMALGFSPQAKYEEREIMFDRPGLVLALGTDGIWEACGPNDEPFGRDRLRDVLRAHVSQAPEQMVKAVFRAVADHRVGEAEDDMTLAVMRRMG